MLGTARFRCTKNNSSIFRRSSASESGDDVSVPLVRHNNLMSPNNSEITHVSDTALMVAACRAAETELQDGFVRDPFAARLAGERGKAILNAMPYANVARMGLSIRA